MTEERIHLAEYFGVLWHRRRFIAVIVGAATVLAALVSLIMPQVFESNAVVLPPPNQGGGLAASANIPTLGILGLGSENAELTKLLAILKSRRILESAIRRFDLLDEFEVKTMEKAVRLLRRNIRFEPQDEGTIRISAFAETSWFPGRDEKDHARHLATDIANFLTEELDRINKELQSEHAHSYRLFVESRYEENLENLRASEETLRAFQEENDIVALPEQVVAGIDAAADLQAQLMATTIQYQGLRHALNENHPEVKKLRIQMQELERQIGEMKDGEEGGLFPLFSDVAGYQIRLYRIQREVEILNKLHAYLAQLYEESKIQEAKDTPTVQVLDVAVVPEKKLKPHRVLIVVTVFMLSLCLSAASVFLRTEFR